jgi:predicted TIM-barrel fold metal-dependent hydrolase
MTEFILDHLCKPPLSNTRPSSVWIEALKSFKEDDNVYMKLSGAFNEFTATPSTVGEIVTALNPYLDIVFECFPDRVMFGSDWPVCNVGGPKGEKDNWKFWKDVVERVMMERGTSEVEMEGVWWRNGAKAYDIDV